MALGSDRVSLETMQPVGAAGLVRVMVNNSFYIPSGGFSIPARLKGASSGPFYIPAGSETLTVTGSGETATVTLPTGYRVTTDAVVRKLLPVLSDVVPENESGHLAFTDGAAIGPASRIQVSGTATAALGFGGQYASRGKELYPGWGLATRQDTITNRFPKFVKPVKQQANFKVTYSVPPQRCLRCRATFVENDWRFSISGDVVLVEDENLLQQAALKILLTRRGSNPYHSWYGSLLMSRTGHKAIGAVATLLQEDVQNALAKLQEAQTHQARYQRVSLKEKLYRVASIEVTPHVSDQTSFMIDVVAYNASGEPVVVTTVFTVPGAVALMGSNGLSLGL